MTGTARRSLIAAAVVAAATGCSVGSVPLPATTAGPSGPVVTNTLGATPARSGAPGSACVSGDLRLSLGGKQGAAGSSYTTLVLTNGSSSPCRLIGWPGVSYLDARGFQVGAAAVRTGNGGGAVVMPPGGTAVAVVQHPNPAMFSGNACEPAATARLRVYPPNAVVALTVADSDSVCSTTRNPPTVSALTSGGGGG